MKQNNTHKHVVCETKVELELKSVITGLKDVLQKHNLPLAYVKQIDKFVTNSITAMETLAKENACNTLAGFVEVLRMVYYHLIECHIYALIEYKVKFINGGHESQLTALQQWKP